MENSYNHRNVFEKIDRCMRKAIDEQKINMNEDVKPFYIVGSISFKAWDDIRQSKNAHEIKASL